MKRMVEGYVITEQCATDTACNKERGHEPGGQLGVTANL